MSAPRISHYSALEIVEETESKQQELGNVRFRTGRGIAVSGVTGRRFHDVPDDLGTRQSAAIALIVERLEQLKLLIPSFVCFNVNTR